MPSSDSLAREPGLLGQTVVVIGGSAGIGLETVRYARAQGAEVALDLAPIRVNLIAPGFVDTPLSASLLGDDLDQRREELRATLPIGAWSARLMSPRSPFTS